MIVRDDNDKKKKKRIVIYKKQMTFVSLNNVQWMTNHSYKINEY